MRSKNVLLVIFIISIVLPGCAETSTQVEKKLDLLKAKALALDSIVNVEAQRLRVLDSVISHEIRRAGKVDSVVTLESNRIDSLVNKLHRGIDKSHP